MLFEKRIFNNATDMKTYLLSKGFVISNGEMRWGAANQDSLCHWSWDDDDGVVNFIDSNGEEAFPFNLSSFGPRAPLYTDLTGVIFCPLKNNGCLLNIAPTPSGNVQPYSPTYLIEDFNHFTLSCELGTLRSGERRRGYVQNGLVACTPAEQDGRWRYSWRIYETAIAGDGANDGYYFPPSFRWVIDNGRAGEACYVPTVERWDTQFAVALSKVYLDQGFLSNNIYMQLMGENEAPGLIFTINGQRFISFCSEILNESYGGASPTYRDSLPYRPVCFLLPDDPQAINDHTSTQEYSQYTIYAEGDYCIYNGALYVCTESILTPEPWDVTHWRRTTVSEALLAN